MRYLNGEYTQVYNRRHGRVGHLFQGRYKAILLDKDSYLLEPSRYVHLNPWRIKKSLDPFRYRWSSLRAYVGKVAVPKWLTVRPEVVLGEVERRFRVSREELRSRKQKYTEARYVASYLLRRHCLMSLRDIGAVVGLHYSAVGNALRRLRDHPKVSQTKSLRDLEAKFKNR